MKALSFLFFIILICAPAQLSASCKQSQSLAELMARSDLVVVARVRRRNLNINPASISLRNQQQLVQIVGLEIEVQEVLKRPYVGSYDAASLQVIHDPVAVRFSEINETQARRFVLFLRYHKKGVWISGNCELLPLDNASMVHRACEVLQDIFKHDRFLYERKCLLAHPALVSLAELKKEVERLRVHAKQAKVRGEVVKRFAWNENEAFQRVVMRFRGREISKLFPFTFRGGDITVTVYIPRESLDERQYRQRFRPSRRVQVQGTWFEGNFVLDSARY